MDTEISTPKTILATMRRLYGLEASWHRREKREKIRGREASCDRRQKREKTLCKRGFMGGGRGEDSMEEKLHGTEERSERRLYGRERNLIGHS